MSDKNIRNEKMESIVSLAKRRGFIYQGSEIYGGMAGMYDYGPYGVELLNNLKSAWWKEYIQKRDNYYGLDAAHPRTRRASSPNSLDTHGHHQAQGI